MISFDVGKGKFNFRVGAIVLDSDNKRFLMNTSDSIDFYVLPGGRVEMGEDTVTSLKREFQEELGVDIDVVCLKSIAENFFEFNGINYHELQYLYVAKLKDKAIEVNTDKFYGVEHKDIFEWKSVADIDKINYKPNCFKESIKEVANGDNGIKHYICKGND